jgi:hypothetical protein
VTPANRRRTALEELDRSGVCLTEARTLHAAGLTHGAASRAYYAAFHAARALLFSAGLETRSHRGLVSLIGEHFVKPGQLSPQAGRVLARMQRDREDADYDTGAVFTAAEAAAMIDRAQEFLAEVRRHLGVP